MHKEIEYLTAAGNRMGGGPVHQSQAFYSTISGSDYGWDGMGTFLHLTGATCSLFTLAIHSL
jgi:hypothetical protein